MAKSDTETSKALVRRYFEDVWGNGRLDLIDELISSEYIGHDPALPDLRGPEGIREMLRELHAAFPDMSFQVDELIGEGSLVATRWTVTGTHRNAFLGLPASGNAITVTGMSFSRVAGDQLVEGWLQRDTLALIIGMSGARPQP